MIESAVVEVITRERKCAPEDFNMETRSEKLVVIEKIMQKLDNRYEAVRVMAREARRLNSLVIRGAEPEEGFKPTTTAMKRLLEDKLHFEYVEKTDEPGDLFSE